MHTIQGILLICIELVILLGGIAFVSAFLRKSKVDGNVQVAAHTGDAETLTFNLNLPSALSNEERQARVFEAFEIVAARRKHTHELMEEIRQKAREENEARLAEIQKAQGQPLQAVPPAEAPEGQA